MNVNDTTEALPNRRSFLKRGLQLGAVAGFDPFASVSRAEPTSTAGKTVDISSGKIRGKVHDGIHAFKGIPYGAPTGGKMRFMAPVKPEPWPGVRDCFTFGHQSPQNMNYVEVLAPQANGAADGYDEDCLCLNVWTPDPSMNRKRPVMFWCHGGGYAQESGSWPWVDGEALSRRGDVVVVTINHRLNLFGYFHLGDVGGEKYAASGNAGMLDLVAALTWVRDNIAQFGGDPGQVMIFGESGGGAKVSTLLAMPSARGLFHRAAVQSGPSLRANTRDAANALTKAMLAKLKIGPDRIDDLQSVPVETLLSVMKSVQSTPGMRARFGPVLDPKILPAHPFDPIASAISSDIPLIIGCNRTEQTFFSLRDDDAFHLTEEGLAKRIAALAPDADAPRVLATYRAAYPGASPSEIFFLAGTDRGVRRGSIRLAERKVAQRSAPVYMYVFAWKSPALGGKLRSPHTAEIPFVFDNTDIPKFMTAHTSQEKELAAKMSQAWIQFARSGEPDHKGVLNWPQYDFQKRATMIFDTTCRVVNDPETETRELWASI
ncbi:MAG TPA: carboxylesterase/lipase family protein [Bryobacteraceae bacterium]|nr:carboxylesterase/lipase family protein [Bryobacteraceae bacterium]